MRTALLSSLLLVAACVAPTLSYSPSSGKRVAQRPAGCKVEVLTVAPGRPFIELGVFDLYGGDEPKYPKTTQELLDTVHSEACQVGADAILARSDSTGRYVGATALHWQEAPAGKVAPASAAVPASAVAP
jgi:hypothetical protein